VDNKRNIAIIPIRLGSRRLPKKNIRQFFGKPIFLYTLEYAQQSGLFETIMVSTESEKVADLCKKNGYPVPFQRPKDLSTDDAQLVQVVEHVLDESHKRGKEFDNLCLLWATAPMRTDMDIRAAYDMLDNDTDAVVGVTDFDLPVFCALKENEAGFMEPLFQEYQKLPSNCQPRTVVDNSAMCWVKVSAFQRYKSWLPPKLKGYWMPRQRSVDVDTIEDWYILEFWYKKLGFDSDQKLIEC